MRALLEGHYVFLIWLITVNAAIAVLRRLFSWIFVSNFFIRFHKNSGYASQSFHHIKLWNTKRYRLVWYFFYHNYTYCFSLSYIFCHIFLTLNIQCNECSCHIYNVTQGVKQTHLILSLLLHHSLLRGLNESLL